MFLPPPPVQEIPLPPVHVTAPRFEVAATTTSAKLTVLDQEQLRKTGGRSLPEQISRAGGIWMQETNLGGGAPTLRGLMGNQILIMVDGVRLNNSATRGGPNQSLNQIDPSIVERVEIYKGSGSVLYGSDGIGGVISVWTKRTSPSSMSGGATGLGGFGQAQGDTAYEGGRLAVGVDYVTSSTGLLAIGSGAHFGDVRTGDGTVPFTGYNTGGLFGSWEQALEEGRSLRFAYTLNRDFDVPRTDRLTVGFGQTVPSDALWHYSLQDRQSTVLSYTDVAENGFFDRFETRFTYQDYTEERTRQGLGSSTKREERDQIQTLGLAADWKKSAGDNQLFTFGFDVYHDDVDSSRRDTNLGTGVQTDRDGAFAPDSRYTGLGLFVQDEIFAFDPFLLTAGLRYSYYDFSFLDTTSSMKESGDFDALTASLEASRQIDDWKLTAGIAQGFRAPNLADLAKDGAFANGDELHNANLDPEQSITVDLGAEYIQGQWSGAAGVFATRIEDLIGRVLIDEGVVGVPGDELFLRENVGRLDLWGAEAAANYRLAEDSPWTVGGQLVYTEGKQKGDGVTPGYEVDARRVPPLHGRTSLKWEDRQAASAFGWVDFSVIFAAKQDRLNPGDANDPRIDPNGTPGWFTLNVDVGGAIDHSSSWWAGVHNLLDEEYRVHGSGFDAPGIGLVVGVRVSR
ncbi:MAG: TonB-dependent receptor [Planctomycetes bacterium]|nr:TonB-dependent receptor [Planctomycetota bacterium]